MRDTTADENLLTLSADTATDKRSVAVMRGRRLLSLVSRPLREAGTAGALTDIDEALRVASVPLRAIELFAVASGPGSFTGLRSGLATMKALAVTLKQPVIGVPTLHAVAYAARPAARLVAMLPAGRGEVFAQVLGVTPDGQVTEHEPAAHVPPLRLVERLAGLGGGVKFAGGGASKFSDVIEAEAVRAVGAFSRASNLREEPGPGEWLLAPTSEILAESVALLAQARFAGGARGAADELRALYVRPSDAELKEQCQAQG